MLPFAEVRSLLLALIQVASAGGPFAAAFTLPLPAPLLGGAIGNAAEKFGLPNVAIPLAPFKSPLGGNVGSDGGGGSIAEEVEHALLGDKGEDGGGAEDDGDPDGEEEKEQHREEEEEEKETQHEAPEEDDGEGGGGHDDGGGNHNDFRISQSVNGGGSATINIMNRN